MTTEHEKYKDELVYDDRANYYYKLERYEEAIENLTKAIELNCDDMLLKCYYFNRGMCYLNLDRNKEAIKDFTKCISLFDENEDEDEEMYFDALTHRMDCYAAMGNYQKAIEDCEYVLDNKEYFDDNDFDRLREIYEQLKELADNEEDEDEGENAVECAEQIKSAFDYLDKYLSSSQPYQPDAITEIIKVFTEFYKAFLFNPAITISILKDMIDDKGCPFDNELLKKIIDFIYLVEQRTVNLSTADKIEYAQKTLQEQFQLYMQQNDNNIDFTKLHYNPTQGRKLDF